ncbi:MAG: hypothetical protein GU357_01060 [Thermofilum sp.]|jgi:hypothetical protein|nr:hypothetical protein [Thermofilum sp.]
MSVSFNEEPLNVVLDKVDSIRIEHCKLRAVLLPEEELSEKEKKELAEAKREIAEGLSVSFEELIEEFENSGLSSLLGVTVSRRAKKVIERIQLFRNN